MQNQILDLAAFLAELTLQDRWHLPFGTPARNIRNKFRLLAASKTEHFKALKLWNHSLIQILVSIRLNTTELVGRKAKSYEIWRAQNCKEGQRTTFRCWFINGWKFGPGIEAEELNFGECSRIVVPYSFRIKKYKIFLLSDQKFALYFFPLISFERWEVREEESITLWNFPSWRIEAWLTHTRDASESGIWDSGKRLWE